MVDGQQHGSFKPKKIHANAGALSFSMRELLIHW